MPFPPYFAWLGVPLILGAVSCRKGDTEQVGAAPPLPASASARSRVCVGGAGSAKDGPSASFFPQVAAGYCLDPNGDTRAYGEGARATMADACAELLSGECDVYRGYGLNRVVTLRYVDGAGSPGAIAVILSRFASREGAFAFFTRRVVGDADPAGTRLVPLDAGAAAVLGAGTAYVVRGEHMAQLSYTNEAESPDQTRASGARALPPLARALGERLPGETAPLPVVARLPEDERLPLGVTYSVGDVLGISGVGPGAVGFYRRGAQRYRILSLRRRDEAAAGDVIETLQKVERAKKLKDMGSPAVAFAVTSGDGGRWAEWVVMQSGREVLGVGDEELVVGLGQGTGTAASAKADEERRKLSRTEKVVLLRHLAASGPKAR